VWWLECSGLPPESKLSQQRKGTFSSAILFSGMEARITTFDYNPIPIAELLGVHESSGQAMHNLDDIVVSLWRSWLLRPLQASLN
jgi:hypothetical protein